MKDLRTALHRLALIRLPLLVASVVASTTCLSLFLLSQLSGKTSFWLGVGINVFIASLYGLISYLDYTRRTPSYPKVAVFTMQINRLVDDLIERGQFDLDMALFYMQMVCDPSRYVVRASDRIEPTSRAYNLTRSQTITIPRKFETKNDTIPLPIDRIAKLSLSNSLKVSLGGGARLTTLSQTSTIAHSILVIDVLVESLNRQVVEGYATIRPLLINFLCQPNPSKESRLTVLAISRDLTGLATSEAELEKLTSVVGFLHSLIDHYPMVVYVNTSMADDTVELSGSRAFRIVIERRVLPIVGEGLTKFIQLQERVRGWLGVQSARITWPLAYALCARSYHIECLGPPGTYLAKQRILTFDGREDTAHAPNCKLLGRYGQRFAHLYVNGSHTTAQAIDDYETPSPYFVASFFERPPGSIAVATFVAWVSLAVVLAAAGCDLGTVRGIDPDAMSVILVLPTLAIAWIGIGGAAGSQSPFSGSLISRAILLATFFVDLYATATFITAQSVGSTPIVLSMDQRPHFHAWCAAVLIVAWLALAGTISWFLRVATYRYFLERQLNRTGSDGDSRYWISTRGWSVRFVA